MARKYYGVQRSDAFLAHYGIKGQHWGVKNGPPYPLESKYKDPQSMSKDMKTWKYSNYTKLQSPDETYKKRSGSCHDQVIFEMQELRRMGYKPKATFVIEHDKDYNCGTTHSYVHYKGKDSKTHWFENAWGGKEGDHIFDSPQAIRKEIKRIHTRDNQFGNSKQYPYIDFVDFSDGDHHYGESLQDFVDNCYKHKN